MKTLFLRIWLRFHPRIQTLMDLVKKPRAAATSKLYVLQVDFHVKSETLQAIQQSLDPIRQKYGIDFLVIEPGMTLRRFDDF